jgi:hypothetical protein
MHRDAHLKDVIVRALAGRGGDTTVINPACASRVHDCQLATRLPRANIIGTDIDPRWASRLHSRRADGGPS